MPVLVADAAPAPEPAFEADIVIASRADVGDGIIALTLTLPCGRPLPAWSPGAHIDVVLPNGTTRQ